MAPSCELASHVHIRRHLGWCYAPLQGPAGAKVAKEQLPYYRLELELRRVGARGLRSRLRWSHAFASHVASPVKLEPGATGRFALAHKARNIRPLLRWLQEPTRAGRYAGLCKELLRSHQMRLKQKILTPQLKWRGAAMARQALVGFRSPYPLSLGAAGKGLMLRYQAKKGDEKRVIVGLLEGTRYIWPLASELPFPHLASVHHIDCSEGACVIEIDYRQRPQFHSTYTVTFQPKKVAAQILHARGYALHDLKKYAEAVRDFRLAWKLDPAFRDARYNQACAHALLKQYEPAARILRGLLEEKAYRVLACRDPDFDGLRKVPRYKGLFGCVTISSRPRAKDPPPRRPRAPN